MSDEYADVAPDIRARFADDIRGKLNYITPETEIILQDYAQWTLKPRMPIRSVYFTKAIVKERLLLAVGDVKFPKSMRDIEATVPQIRRHFKMARYSLYMIANHMRWAAIKADVGFYSEQRFLEVTVDAQALEKMLADIRKKCQSDPTFLSEQLAVWTHGMEIITEWT